MSQYNLALIEHKVDDKFIYQRSQDGYVNATAMCQAANKNVEIYFSEERTSNFLEQLSSVMNISKSILVQEILTGDSSLDGIWVHPRVAINLAQWCSPAFDVQVSSFIHDWMQGNNPAQKLIQHWQFYLARTSILHNSVPEGYFSVFHEAAPMIVAMIQSGVVVDSSTVPDISIGMHWSKYWKAYCVNNHSSPIEYNHYYPDIFPQAASNPQKANAYPDSALSDFRRWMRDTYLPQNFPRYVSRKQKQGQIPPTTANKLIDAFGSRNLR